MAETEKIHLIQQHKHPSKEQKQKPYSKGQKEQPSCASVLFHRLIRSHITKNQEQALFCSQIFISLQTNNTYVKP